MIYFQRDGEWKEVCERVLHEQLRVHADNIRGGKPSEVQGRLLEGFPQGGRLLRDGKRERDVPRSSTADASDD